MPEHSLRRIGSLLTFCVLLLLGCTREQAVLDEASRAGRTAGSFPAADEDYFRDMDGGVALSPAEVQGRNTWIVWTGGNDRFWDAMTASSFGVFDLLKIISSHPSLEFQPGRTAGTTSASSTSRASRRPPGPIPTASDCGSTSGAPTVRPTPSRTTRSTRASRSARGARGSCPSGPSTVTRPASSACGSSPIPTSTRPPPRSGTRRSTTRRPATTSARSWCGRIASACPAVSATSAPTRVKPPADPENPKWENLSSNVGAQYFWVDRIFSWKRDPVQLHVPAPPHVAAGEPGHLAGLHGLHQQPAHHERGVPARPAARDRQALGQGDAGRAAG